MTWLLPSYSWVLLCIHWHQIQGAWFRSQHSSHNLSLLWHSCSSVSSVYSPVQPSPPVFSVQRQKHTDIHLCLSELFLRISQGLNFSSVTSQMQALAQANSAGTFALFHTDSTSVAPRMLNVTKRVFKFKLSWILSKQRHTQCLRTAAATCYTPS